MEGVGRAEIGLLVAGPLLYWVNSALPWSRALWGGGDSSAFGAFWGSVAALHWVTVGVVLAIAAHRQIPRRALGLDHAPITLIGMPLVLGAAGGLFLYLWHRTGGVDLGRAPSLFGDGGPDSAHQRAAWIALALTAGICEELVYRGFALDVARRIGWSSRTAVGVTAVPFILLHGPAAIGLWPVYLAGHLGFSALLRRTGSLLPGIALHTLIDLTAILRA